MAERPHHRREIEARQLELIRALLQRVALSNPFYQQKFKNIPTGSLPTSLAEFSERYPLTVKGELVADQAAQPPFGRNLTRPLPCYTRFHQTSGTTGQPLRWLDTPASWSALVDNWVQIYAAAGVTARDRIYFAFSFGPFIGFWLAFDAAQRLGALGIPGGGLSSAGRLRAILDNQITVLCCTPTYALRLAEVAREEQLDLGAAAVRVIIVAGEPGGSVPAVRSRLESTWPGARVFDHHGMTEVGPVTYECPSTPGMLHVIESAYFSEVIDPQSNLPLPPGETGELVLTTLTRVDSPLIRYRTGDLVKIKPSVGPCACGRVEIAFDGGILGRVDEMLVVRGINIFPGAIDEVLGQFAEIAEFQVRVSREQSLAQLEVLAELREPYENTAAEVLRRVETRLQTSFNLRVPVRLAPPGSLPRFEMKARRWVFS